MHLLSTTLDEPRRDRRAGRSRPAAGRIVVLSFADSDLAGLAAAWAVERDALPSVRLAHLRDLRHPMSVDLWIERVGAPRQGDRGPAARRARLVALRRRAARRRSRASAASRWRVLPGEDRDDPRLAAGLDLAAGRARRAARAISAKAGARICARCCAASPAMPGARLDAPSRSRCRALAGYLPGEGAVESRCARRRARAGHGRSCRSSSIARCCSPPTPRRSTRCARRWPRAGLRRRRCSSPSLKDAEAGAFVRGALRAARAGASSSPPRPSPPAAMPDEPTPLDGVDVPVLQVVIATTQARGLARQPARARRRRSRHACRAAGARRPRARRRRRLQGSAAELHDGARLHRARNRPEPDRIAMVADRDRRAGALAATPRARAADRGADAGLSRRAGPHRLCGRARRAGERASRCSPISPKRATRVD